MEGVLAPSREESSAKVFQVATPVRITSGGACAGKADSTVKLLWQFAAGGQPLADGILSADFDRAISFWELIRQTAVKDPGFLIIPALDFNVLVKFGLELGIVNGANDFEAAVKIAGKKVGGTEEVSRLAAIFENKDAGVFQIAVHNADGLKLPTSRGTPIDEAEHATADQSDTDACLGSLIEQ